MFSRLINNQKGSMAIITAASMVALVASIGLAVDYSLIYKQRAGLQAAADSAALASARELGLVNIRVGDIEAIASQYVKANFSGSRSIGNEANDDISLKATISPNDATVTIDLEYIWEPFFAHIISDNVLPLRASATASLAGNPNVCVITLDESSPNSLIMFGNSRVSASDCGVYVNSESPNAINLGNNAELISIATFSAGGYNGNGTYQPSPVTDSPPITDPLINRQPPQIGSCIHQDVIKGDITLNPGTYCGGIKTQGKAIVKLNPGEYVIQSGVLDINQNATLKGEGVGFYFTGANSGFNFASNSTIDLTAPEEGIMAGLLFFQDRNVTLQGQFNIESRNAGRLEGVVYLPGGRLNIRNDSKVGELSNWTAIIVNRLNAGISQSNGNSNKPGPQIALNSDYGASSVPVPAGIAGEEARPRLVSR